MPCQMSISGHDKVMGTGFVLSLKKLTKTTTIYIYIYTHTHTHTHNSLQTLDNRKCRKLFSLRRKAKPEP